MSNSQDQSLDEDTVFLPVTESCPEFLHCERERYAVERLMSAGPEDFYTCLGTEHLGCFLSPDEVNQISSWTQEYHISQLQVGKPAEGGTELQDFSDCYFPAHSDCPAPCLELGWPEKVPWTGRGNVSVHTSPPAEGQLPIREVIRRHLQAACHVIAIVTDRLTDSSVIGDLHNAATRGVPVYIILNQRSFQENFTPSRLRHPNMQVRVLGGKTFISRGGQMAIGDMKDNFLLVDLETVIHGSYSLTWTDAHLHRQLITVLNGPVVETFDQEFRVLYAASFPIPDTWKAASPPVDAPIQFNKLSDFHYTKQPPRGVSSPPPPPVDSPPLDWEALGVIQRYSDLPDSPICQDGELPTVTMDRTLVNSTSEKPTTITNQCTYNKKRIPEDRREYDYTTTVTQLNNDVQDRLSSLNIELPTVQSSLKTTNIEMHERVGHRIEQAYYRGTTDGDEKPKLKPVENKMESNSRNMRNNYVLEEINLRGGFRDESASSRKPLILRVPQRENFSSLSDIMRRLQPHRRSSGLLRRGANTAASDMTRSMMDLSVQDNSYQDERKEPVPRFKANYFDPGLLTSGFALMKKRNDKIKLGLYRPVNAFVPSTRPNSTNFGIELGWRRPRTEREEEHSQQE